jgi:hypothetical protein
VGATTSVCALLSSPACANAATLYWKSVRLVSGSCMNVPANWPSSVKVKFVVVVAYWT